MVPLDNPRIRIHLFGSFAVEVSGVDVTAKLPGRKGRAALAYLAIHAQGASRDEFVNVLWPDKRPADPRANLRTLLSRIRDAIGTEALEDDRRLRLAGSAIWLDLSAAGDHVAAATAARHDRHAEAAVEHARAAVDILDRPFLPDLEGEWIDRIRRGLERDLGEMLACIADMGSIVGGDFGDEAIAAARELVARDGYLERSHGLLMLALVRRGESAEALRAYESLRQQLLDELGTSPGAELQALHTAILREECLSTDAEPRADPAWSADDFALPPPVAAAAERPFIGRTRELDQLTNATATPGRFVTVSGPPGIGKSRLVIEAARMSAGEAAVLFGRCDEGMAVPFQPFIEALGHLVRPLSDDDVGRLLGRTRLELAKILPDAGDPSSTRTGSIAKPDRYHLFDAVSTVLRTVAATTHVVLILDDLHWADEATQQMLRHVERAVRDVAVTFVITYRDTPADQMAGFGELFADIRHERDVTRIELDGMSEEEISALLESERRGPAPDELVSVVRRRTGGNPLYARELTRDLLTRHGDDGAWPTLDELAAWPVPDGIRQLVARRLAVLKEADRTLLARASTLGRVIRPDVVAVAAGADPQDALAAFEAALGAGIVTARSGERGSFAFSHPLIRDALIATISPAKLGHLHMDNAERLEEHWGPSQLDAHLIELAHHRLAAAEAGLDLEGAIAWAERAARHAERGYAYEASIALQKRMLALLPAEDVVSRQRRCGLLLGIAAVQWRSGQRDASRLTRRRAFDLAAQIDDADLMAVAAIGHERYFELNTFEADEHAMTREALSRLPEGPSPRRAQLLAKLSRIDHWSGDPALTAAVAGEAVRLARDVDDHQVLSDALNALLLAYRAPGHSIQQRLDTAAELIDLAQRTVSPERRVEGEAHLLLALVEGGRTRELRAAVERFGRIVEGVRQPFWIYFRQAWAATLAFIEGDLDRAERLHEIATATARGARSDAEDGGAAATVQIVVEQGHAAAVADLADQFVTGGIHPGVWRSGVAMVLGRAGRVSEAQQVLDELVGPSGVRLPRDVLWGMGACLLADAAHACGHREAAAVLYAELAATPRWIAMAGSGRGFLLVSQRLGQLAQVMGQHTRALAHFAEARTQGQELAAGLIIAWSEIETAATLIDRGAPADLARAELLLASVEGFAEGRGLGLIEQRLKALRSAGPRGPAFAVTA
jgi:DNA-binding SARP family transcriptional activator